MANTKPPVDNVETVKYIHEEERKTGINVLPAACVSVGMKGQELTDMDALKAAGAVGFTDDGIPLMNEKLVYEAMKKAKELNVPLSFHEEDRHSSPRTESTQVQSQKSLESQVPRHLLRILSWPVTA